MGKISTIANIIGEKRATEERADSETLESVLSALISSGTVSKSEALAIPTVAGCIEFISNTISMLPVKLYKESDGAVTEIKDDDRVRLLNDDTGDTLNSTEFWKSMVTDYFLGKGGYAYIKKSKNKFNSIHYVNEEAVSINKNSDPIFKDYNILVNGTTYRPFDFLKILRYTKDGCSSPSIVSENNLLFSICYYTMKYEKILVSTGGNKKGFLTSDKQLTQTVIDQLQADWNKLYSNSTENMMVLNSGLKFEEASQSSVELQLNENKETNAKEICKLFNLSANLLNGTASYAEYANAIKLAVMPILHNIECSLNRDMLLDKEKKNYYWSYDTGDLLKGDIVERYNAYSQAVTAGWLSKNEIRYKEDLPMIEGLDIITMNLADVIYDIKSKKYFTPNTKTIQNGDMGNLDDNTIENTNEDTVETSDSNETDIINKEGGIE